MHAARRFHLGVALDGAGSHPAAWRATGASPERLFAADYWVELVQLAERGGLDFAILPDSFRIQSAQEGSVRGKLDALLVAARVAPVTSRIGLVPAITTTHTEPFHVSKNVATLDLVSGGRAGWLVDVSLTEAEAGLFGRRPVAPPEELYAEAAEAIDVVRRLWDSWEDGAVIRDVGTGRYIDRDLLHYVDFDGRFFSVRGPSITPRSPQAQPVVMIEASDPHAAAAGAAFADVIVIDAEDVDDARRQRRLITELVDADGRDVEDVLVLVGLGVMLGATVEDARSEQGRLDALAADALPRVDVVGNGASLAVTIAEWADSDAVDGVLLRPATLPGTLQHIVDDAVPVLRDLGIRPAEQAGTTLRDHFGLDRPRNRYAAEVTA